VQLPTVSYRASGIRVLTTRRGEFAAISTAVLCRTPF
jgi:hypothetical protein